MSTWSKDELRQIAETDDLHISPFREDGKTHGTPTWIWSVVVDDAYRATYEGSPYLKPMISSRARSATVKVMPRAGLLGCELGRQEVHFCRVADRERGRTARSVHRAELALAFSNNDAGHKTRPLWQIDLGS